MVKVMAVLAAVLVLASSTQAIKEGDAEAQGNRGKKFGLDKKGIKLLSNRLVYGKLVSMCKNRDQANTLPVDAGSITDVDIGKKCGLPDGVLKDGAPVVFDINAAPDVPAEPVCGSGDDNTTKVKKLKEIRAHRALRTALVFCAKDLREVCGFNDKDEPTCTEQVLSACPTITTAIGGVPTLDAAEMCKCEKSGTAEACWKSNNGLGNGRLLFGLGGAQKPDTDKEAKGQLGGAIRSIRNCFFNNTADLSKGCTDAIKLLAAKATAEKAALAAVSGATTGRRQLQVDLSPLDEAADTLDPQGGSASGLGAPLALALAVLALNRF